MNKLQLPKNITVVIKKCDHDKFIAELPEYDVFTEFDDISESSFYVNDLIYVFFDIPRRLRDKIVYRPVIKESQENLDKLNKALLFNIFSTPDIYKKYLYS